MGRGSDLVDEHEDDGGFPPPALRHRAEHVACIIGTATSLDHVVSETPAENQRESIPAQHPNCDLTPSATCAGFGGTKEHVRGYNLIAQSWHAANTFLNGTLQTTWTCGSVNTHTQGREVRKNDEFEPGS